MQIGLQIRLLSVRTRHRGLRYSWRHSASYLSLFLEHTTPRKLANALLAKVQKWLRRDRVRGMPYRYTIDPLNVCNLRCALCPTGLGTLKRERGKISFEDYKRLVDQIAPHAYLVELYNWGEPFLHPQIFDMIEYASSRKIAVRLSTNLNHFSEEMAIKTVRSGLDAMIVSVDGATQATYEKYRRRGRLDRVLSNLETLVAQKKKAKSRKPFITFRMLVNRYNETEIESLRHIASSLDVDAFTIGALFIDTSDPAQVKEWLPSREELSYYDYSSGALENVWHCSDLWESMTINCDGGLSPCCWLHDKKNDYEDALARPLKEIWNGPAYVSSRRVFARGGPKQGTVKTICTVCRGRPQFLKS